MSERGPDNDSVVRAITDDGAFRVIVTRTTETVRGAVRAQNAKGETAKNFGELLTGAILIREAMAPRLRVQSILRVSPEKSLVADSHPDGTSRGLVQHRSTAENKAIERERFSASPGAILQVMRTLPSGSLHQGVVELPEVGGISAGLMTYMQESEQVVSMIAVATVLEEGEPKVAGGYLVQLLPEVERGPLMVMTERLQAFDSLEEALKGGGSPDTLLAELLYGMPFTRLEDTPLSFGCNCSQVRVLTSLATLPRSDVEELYSAGEVLEIKCDYCGKDYAIAPEQLRALLAPS